MHTCRASSASFCKESGRKEMASRWDSRCLPFEFEKDSHSENKFQKEQRGNFQNAPLGIPALHTLRIFRAFRGLQAGLPLRQFSSFPTRQAFAVRLAEPEIDPNNPIWSSNRAVNTVNRLARKGSDGAAGNMCRHPIPGQNALGFHTPFFLKVIKCQVKSPSLHGFCTGTASSPDNCATTALQPSALSCSERMQLTPTPPQNASNLNR